MQETCIKYSRKRRMTDSTAFNRPHYNCQSVAGYTKIPSRRNTLKYKSWGALSKGFSAIVTMEPQTDFLGNHTLSPSPPTGLHS